MKERLIITEKSLIESTKHIAKEYDKEDVAEHIIEQVPETFEELKELLKIYSGKINKDVSGYSIGKRAITIVFDGINLHFDKDGIYTYYKRYKRTPQQMWQIIKSLIEEE